MFRHKHLKTVGELIDALGRYDRNLPIKFVSSWGNVPNVESDCSESPVFLGEGLRFFVDPGVDSDVLVATAKEGKNTISDITYVSINGDGDYGTRPSMLAPEMREAIKFALTPARIFRRDRYYNEKDNDDQGY